jgi:hypothetical protein
VDLEAWTSERVEEAEALDVVEMKVGEQDVDPPNVGTDGGSESSDAGTGVEHDDAVGAGADLDARGVAAVAHRLGPGRRN